MIRDFLLFEIRKNLDLRTILVTPKIFLKSRFHCTSKLRNLWKLFNNLVKMYVNAPSKIVPSHCVRVELPWEEIEGPKPLQKWLLMHFRFISGHSAWPGQASISIDSIWNSKSFFIIYLFIQIILYSCQSKNLTMANILNKKLYWISL